MHDKTFITCSKNKCCNRQEKFYNVFGSFILKAKLSKACMNLYIYDEMMHQVISTKCMQQHDTCLTYPNWYKKNVTQHELDFFTNCK